MDGFHLPIYHLTYMSFCTQGLLGVAESTAPLREGPPSPWGEGARQDVRGFEKMFRLALTHRLRSPPSPEGRGLFWMRDSATSPFGSAQNDSVSIGMSESFLIRETKLKGV